MRNIVVIVVAVLALVHYERPAKVSGQLVLITGKDATVTCGMVYVKLYTKDAFDKALKEATDIKQEEYKKFFERYLDTTKLHNRTEEANYKAASARRRLKKIVDAIEKNDEPSGREMELLIEEREHLRKLVNKTEDERAVVSLEESKAMEVRLNNQYRFNEAERWPTEELIFSRLSKPMQQSQTDNDGMFMMPNVAEGDYVLVAEQAPDFIWTAQRIHWSKPVKVLKKDVNVSLYRRLPSG